MATFIPLSLQNGGGIDTICPPLVWRWGQLMCALHSAKAQDRQSRQSIVEVQCSWRAT